MESLILLVMLSQPPQRAEEAHFLRPARAAILVYGVGQMSDGFVTAWGLGSGELREMNPLLSWAEDRPAAMGIAKGALAAGSIYVLVKLHRKHPKATFWTAVGLGALQAYITVRNVRLLRR